MQIKPINHLSVFSAFEYIMVLKATLLAWWKMNPTLQRQTKPPVLVAMRGNDEQKPKSLLKFLLHTRVARARSSSWT